MERKSLFGTVLALSLTLIIAVAAVIPTFAYKQSSGKTFYSVGGGEVTLQLPQGNPEHPTAFRIFVDSYDKRSEGGVADTMIVFMWWPTQNTFTPVAYISDNQEHNEFMKLAWSKTFVWHAIGNIPENIIKVDPDQLEVRRQGDVVTANLNVEVSINLISTSFTLPSMTIAIRGIDKAYVVPEKTAALPSGYTATETQLSKPAWVAVEIPAWLGTMPIEFAGGLDVHGTMTYTAPALP
jgi:hypothetical protein